MRGQLANSKLSCVLLDDVPDDFLRNLPSPNVSPAADTPKNSTMGNLRCAQPIIDGLFHPIRHRHRADMPSLAYEINNRPMVFPPLSRRLNRRVLCTARMARSRLPFTLCILGRCHKEGASSTVSQLPSLMPSFFAPFTRRMPAAKSGLSNTVSAAS